MKEIREWLGIEICRELMEVRRSLIEPFLERWRVPYYQRDGTVHPRARELLELLLGDATDLPEWLYEVRSEDLLDKLEAYQTPPPEPPPPTSVETISGAETGTYGPTREWPPQTERVIERYLKRIDIRENGCWGWISKSINPLFSVDGKQWRSPRLAPWLLHGIKLNHWTINRIDECVLQQKCHNPDHMEEYLSLRAGLVDDSTSSPSSDQPHTDQESDEPVPE